MNFILFDDHSRSDLLPFTFTRPVSEIRVGILTITEKWKLVLDSSVSFLTQDYLSEKYSLSFNGKQNIWINGKVCPDKKLLKEIKKLKEGQAIWTEDVLAAFHSGRNLIRLNQILSGDISSHYDKIISESKPIVISNPWDIFTQNAQATEHDFELITKGRVSQPLNGTNKFAALDRIFIEEGAKVECSTLNASTGPIYIGKNAEVMEGCLIRGPFVLGEGAVLKMGAKIYGATTLGPGCKAGGEINNSVFFSNSNKAHDGFIGNSVIGEWCNLGADTNNSNLKNNYASVKIWSHSTEEMVDTGLQFCGIFMGDHSKCGINTMFNTGTVIGVNTNIYGGDFPIHFIPSFSWGGAEAFEDYRLDKALETARRVLARRNMVLSKSDTNILTHIYNLSKKFRAKED